MLVSGAPSRLLHLLPIWYALCESFLRRTGRSLMSERIAKFDRPLSGNRHLNNVGVLGRPENDGRTDVWYTLLEAGPRLRVEFVPVEHDHLRLAREMREEGFPEEFIETVRTGWWTTCLEILPAKEWRRGKF
jgi:hypothetical protein